MYLDELIWPGMRLRWLFEAEWGAEESRVAVTVAVD